MSDQQTNTQGNFQGDHQSAQPQAYPGQVQDNPVNYQNFQPYQNSQTGFNQVQAGIGQANPQAGNQTEPEDSPSFEEKIAASTLMDMDIFEMLGLHELPNAKKKGLFIRMQESMWLDIFAIHLKPYITDQDWEELKRMMKEGKEVDELLEYLDPKIENMETIIFFAMMDFKKNYYIRYLSGLKKSVEQDIELISQKENPDQELLLQKQNRLRTLVAMIHFSKIEEWDKVQILLPEMTLEG